jgi:hypothetical protein
MQRLKRHMLWTLGAGALAVVVGLTGCSTNSTAPSQVLTQAQADTVAEAVAADVAVLPEGMTYSGTAAVPVQSAPMRGALLVPQSTGAGCTPTKSPASPLNSDGDPVPDSVRYDFTGCVITIGNFTLTLAGTIDFVDPTPTVTDFALKTAFTNFIRTLTDNTASKTRSVKENGSRTVSGSTSSLQRTETGFRTDYTFADGSTDSHVRTWSATFTADVGGSIRRDSLPNGTWDLTGTSTWTRGTNSYSLSVTTNPQLHYNAACTVTPRFDAGTLSAVVTKNNVTTNVTIHFTACGQYTVTRS